MKTDHFQSSGHCQELLENLTSHYPTLKYNLVMWSSILFPFSKVFLHLLSFKPHFTLYNQIYSFYVYTINASITSIFPHLKKNRLFWSVCNNLFQCFLIHLSSGNDHIWLINAFHCFLTYDMFQLSRIQLISFWDFSQYLLTNWDTLVCQSSLHNLLYPVPAMLFLGNLASRFENYIWIRVDPLCIPRMASHVVLSGKELTCQCRRHKRCRFIPWVRKIPWRGEWQPTPVFLPGESHGQRSLVGYTPWDHKVRPKWSDLASKQANP